MPAGCEFVCKNNKCDCYEAGFVINGAWPIADIDQVLLCSALRENKTFKKELEEHKATGRKYACIVYPNYDSLVPVGYRIQLWCDDCKCVWEYDVMIDEDGSTVEELLEKDDTIPEFCPKCTNILLDFDKVLEDNIGCPSCQTTLQQHRWFSKEA